MNIRVIAALLLALMPFSTTSAQSFANYDGEFPEGVRVWYHLMVPMRDGVKLHTNVLSKTSRSDRRLSHAERVHQLAQGCAAGLFGYSPCPRQSSPPPRRRLRGSRRSAGAVDAENDGFDALILAGIQNGPGNHIRCETGRCGEWRVAAAATCHHRAFTTDNGNHGRFDADNRW